MDFAPSDRAKAWADRLTAFMQGKMKIDGDMSVAMSLSQLM